LTHNRNFSILISLKSEFLSINIYRPLSEEVERAFQQLEKRPESFCQKKIKSLSTADIFQPDFLREKNV